MSTKNFQKPNWAQMLIARGAGLEPKEVVVRFEDDTRITFLKHINREEITVDKRDGAVSSDGGVPRYGGRSLK